MRSPAALQDASPEPPLLAPAWHTFAFVALLLAGPILSLLMPHAAPTGSRITGVYVPLLATEWGLFLFVWLGGLRLKGVPLASILGPRRRTVASFAIDVGLAVLGWAVVTMVELLWPGANTVSLLPVGTEEKLVWVAVSLSAAFVEETIFRGYLLRQFRALTGSSIPAVVLQAVLFAVPHGEQGLLACLKIFGYGLMLGLIAVQRRSLRAGLFCHAWIDLASGLLRI